MGAIMLIAIIIIVLLYANAESNKIASLPKLSISATVIEKEKVKVIEKNMVDDMQQTTERIEHKVTFETDNHLRWTFNITPGQFDCILQGDFGTLIYKELGQKLYFVTFIRTK